MAILKDYIWCLTASVMDSRAKLDAQAAILAQKYLENDLLRHFPVPRMRVGNVTMDVPIAIDSVDGKDIDVDVTTDEIFQIICTECNCTPSASAAGQLREHIKSNVQNAKLSVQNSQSLDDLSDYSGEIANGAITIIGTEGEDIDIDKLRLAIEDALRNAFLNSPCNVKVIVESGKLKDESPQSILNLKIQIVEEGMVWAISERKEGEETVIDTKLIPE